MEPSQKKSSELDLAVREVERISDSLGRLLTVSAFAVAVSLSIRYQVGCEGASPWLLLPLSILALVGALGLFLMLVLGLIRPLLDRYQHATKSSVRSEKCWGYAMFAISVLLLIVSSNVFFQSVLIALRQADTEKICAVAGSAAKDAEGASK